MKYFLTLLSICQLTMTYSQSTPSFEKLKALYPDDIGIYTERSKQLTLTIEGDSLRCAADVEEKILFLKDQLTHSNQWRVYGSYFLETENLEAKAVITENGRSKEIKLPPAVKKREDDQSVFYDDSYFYTIALPAGREGNSASWTYHEKYRDPRFLPSYFISGSYPILKTSFVIRAAKGIELAYSVYNDPDGKIKFKQYSRGGYTYYEWVAENLQTIPIEEDSPSSSYIVPHIVYYVKSYPTKAGSKSLLSGVDDLFKSYKPSVAGLNETPSPALDSLVHSLIKTGDSEKEIVRKVFYWVQDHVRYIAFEDGMRGLVPHTPNYIFEKRYGDCKDMASLLVGMLRVAGIQSYYTWIGTRTLPYKYSLVPTPLVDNHMIATYIDEQRNYYFLDATGNYTRLGLPSSMIQEKEALIALPSGYEIQTVPRIPATENLKKDSVRVRIENKLLVGTGVSYFTGYEKVTASYEFDKAREESRKDNVVNRVKKGNNKFYLDAYKIFNLNNKDEPLKLDYQFRISDYVSELNDELYLNLNLSKEMYNHLLPANRKLALENDYQVQYDEVYELAIPEGYTVSYLPPNAALDGKSVDFEINYAIKGNTLVRTSKVNKHFLMLTPELFADWNTSIGRLSKAYKETILLKKKTK